MSSFVPDQRKVPSTAGSMRKKGATTGCGMRPSTTMGSEKVTRISFACSMSVTSPSGPVWRTASSCARAGAAASSATPRTADAPHPILIQAPPRCRPRVCTAHRPTARALPRGNARKRASCCVRVWTAVDTPWAKGHGRALTTSRGARYKGRVGKLVQDAPATRARRAENVLELIGQTPLLRLSRYAAAGAELWAKLEFLNPGGSVKDRAALGMIDAAERSGELQPGATIIEPTAGNTGIGLALIGINRGYRVVLVVLEKSVGPKTAVMNVLGAEMILTPTGQGGQGAIAKARALAASLPNTYVPQ